MSKFYRLQITFHKGLTAMFIKNPLSSISVSWEILACLLVFFLKLATVVKGVSNKSKGKGSKAISIFKYI